MPLVLGIRYPLAGVRGLRRPSIGLLEESRLSMRAWPRDCDVYLHVNNGRYLSLMDIGRIDHAARTGVLAVFRRTGWRAVAAGATIRFRRELRMFSAYSLTTRLVGWDDGWAYWEQQFTRSDGALAARAFAKVAVLDERGTRVEPARLVEACGHPGSPPQLPEQIHDWQHSGYG